MSRKLVGTNIDNQYADYSDRSVEIDGLNLPVKDGGARDDAKEIEGPNLPGREKTKPEQHQGFEFEGLNFSAKN